MATDAERIVTDFCNAWPRKNVDELLAFFTEDAVYHNIPLESAKGKDAIRGVINTFLPMARSLQFNQRARRHLRSGQRQNDLTASSRRLRSNRLEDQRMARLLRYGNVHQADAVALSFSPRPLFHGRGGWPHRGQ